MSKKHKKKKKMPQKSPEEAFLSSLGIRPYNRDSARRQFESIVREEGITVDARDFLESDWITGEANEFLFASKQMGALAMSLRREYLLRCLKSLGWLGGIPPALGKIVELGSAAGVFSLYLAGLHPDCDVICYDHYPEPLEVGASWAADLGLGNIRFEEASYEELSRRPPSYDCDLVLLYSGFSLPQFIESGGFFSTKEALKIGPPAYPPDVSFAAKAATNLLRPNGIGIISCFWDEWGIAALIDAIEKAGLSIDWDNSVNIPDAGSRAAKLAESYLIVGKKFPAISCSLWEQARSFYAGAQFAAGAQELSGFVLESYSDLFESGTRLFGLEITEVEGAGYRAGLRTHGGLLLFEAMRTGGPHIGYLGSLSQLGPFLRSVDFYLKTSVEKSLPIRVTTLHRTVEEHLGHYALTDIPYLRTSLGKKIVPHNTDSGV